MKTNLKGQKIVHNFTIVKLAHEQRRVL